MSTTETDQVFILIQEILSQKLLPAKKNKFLNSITRATWQKRKIYIIPFHVGI